MCKLCEERPVYEFTNQRKLCKRCFINYFHKKLLYTVRRFKMIKPGDTIGYKFNNSFKGVVLEEMLSFLKKKSGLNIIKLPNKKINKIAIDSSLDSESREIVHIIIKGNSSEIKKSLPIEKNIIKPLYLFLDEEILLYAKLRNLKFKITKEKKNLINEFIDDFEKKHLEVKRAIVNSLLKMGFFEEERNYNGRKRKMETEE